MKKKELVNFHKKLIIAVGNYRRSEYQLQYLQNQVFILDDIINSLQPGKEKRIISPFRKRRTGWAAKLLDFPEWIYYAYVHKILFRFMAILCIPFALTLVYCQFTPLFISVMKNPKDISVFSLLVRSMAHVKPAAQLVSLVLVALMAFVTLFALFKIEIKFLHISLYRLIPHHSDSYSILYTSIFLSRVVPTLCYNFLQIIGVRIDDGVAFYRVMGPLRIDGLKGIFGKVGFLEILGGGFSNFFPLFMVVVSAVTFFNVLSYLPAWCGVEKKFDYKETMNEELNEGRRMLAQGTEI